jgi:hypothetical protein
MDRIFLIIMFASVIMLVTALAFIGPPAETDVPALALKERIKSP